jgi:alanine-alpha-ketoisovalerate/valine-pyruvate aminotransferase
MVTAKVKAVNKGLSRVRKAMDQDENPLSVAEVDFVQTCCWILGIDSKEKIDSICKRALADGKGNVRKTMSAITNLLDELGWEAKKHKREAPGPSLTTWP